jgi:type III pantothenate kinase
MKLVIDLGNTFHKLAVFSDDDMIHFESYLKLSTETLASVLKNFTISSSILSSVINHSADLEKQIKSHCHLIVFDHLTQLPITNLYQTPETLGKDRLASVVGVNYLFPAKDVLVIEAGSCIKYDFINARSEYIGGAISPGLKMRFQALHTFTEKLPLVELNNFDSLTGVNTNDSLLSGVINGSIAEIDGIIEMYKKIYPEIQVVLSGGDAEYLVSKLKNKTFAVSNIVLKGLKIILDYNDNQQIH